VGVAASHAADLAGTVGGMRRKTLSSEDQAVLAAFAEADRLADLDK
jgi:hypothetical protein